MEELETEKAPETTSEPSADSQSLEGLVGEQAELISESTEPDTTAAEVAEAEELAILEAVVYITDEPLSLDQLAVALGKSKEHVRRLLDLIVEEYNKPTHGLMVREIAGGYKMATKPEHHEAVRAFVKKLNPPLKLSLAALETLSVIAYKQPITAPEIMEIRGVQGAGVLKTLLDRKLITTSGRKAVVGKPILYKTTKDFLVQFGLKDLNELPTLKEFEELRRLALGDADEPVLGTGAEVNEEAEEVDTLEAEAMAGGDDDDHDGEKPSPAPSKPEPELPTEQPPEPESPGQEQPEPEGPGHGNAGEPESPGQTDPDRNA